MQLSYKDKSHDRVEYFPLPNGYVDVFLHKNERIEIDEEGDLIQLDRNFSEIYHFFTPSALFRESSGTGHHIHKSILCLSPTPRSG